MTRLNSSTSSVDLHRDSFRNADSSSRILRNDWDESECGSLTNWRPAFSLKDQLAEIDY
jgi:hypothetical protein